MSDSVIINRGQDALLRGQFEKARWALDAALYLQQSSSPENGESSPGLWQRGLSSFYSGHFQEGVAQFEHDMSDNGDDIEEVIWHFICRCGIYGFQNAHIEGFLPLRKDSISSHPPPMEQVLQLFKGTGSIQDVLTSATSTNGSPVKSYNDTDALAYAYFYIGLFHEMRREFFEARESFKVAAEFKNPDFMGQLMEMHFDLCRYKFPFGEEGLDDISNQSNLIYGGWQLSEGHLINCKQDNLNKVAVVRSLLRVIDAGIHLFDCGDIYSGVEELYGLLIKAHCFRGGNRNDIAIHTKLVPDLECIRNNFVDRHYIESIVRRSLNRLGLQRLSLVQFHWWDKSVAGYVEALSVVNDLVREGLIEKIGLTNFSMETTKEFIDAHIQIASTQVQYSLLDRRPLTSGLVSLCEEHGIDILAYGVLAGGFLTDHWLGKDEPDIKLLSNRSLVKYLLIIEEFGGWKLFQELLQTLRTIAERHGVVVSIAMVAISYVLRQKQVKSVIIGAHNDKHVQSTVAASTLELTLADLADIESVLTRSKGPKGPVFGLERVMERCHGSIMKYNLNCVNKGVHLEELCHRYLHLHFEGHPVDATRTGYRFSLPDNNDNNYRLELPPPTLPNARDFDFDKISLYSMKACNYDYHLGPQSELEIQAYCSKVNSMLKEADSIERESLSPDQLVNLNIIVSQLKLELLEWNSVQRHKKDPAFYLPLNSILYLLPTWGPELEGTGDDRTSLSHHHPGVMTMTVSKILMAVLSRLRLIPSTLIQAHHNLTQPVKLFVQTCLDICESFGMFLVTDLHSLCGILVTEDKSQDFSNILAEIETATSVAAQCIKKYESFLRDVLLPKSSVALGVGKETYEKIIEYTLFMDSTDSLLALGEGHFSRVKAELESLAKDIDPSKSWQEITTEIINPMHPTASQLLQSYMSEIRRSRDHMISHDLVSDLPEDEKVVGFSTPRFLIPFSPVGDYLNPSPFAGMGRCRVRRDNEALTFPRVGHLMLHSIEAKNLSESEEEKLLRGHDYTWISVVSPHESYPGHHIQALRAQDHPRVLRKFHESILFYEGWGLYTEELSYESGFFNKDLTYQVEGSSSETRTVPASQYALLTRMTQLRLQLWRAARIILDIKMNTGELSFEDCREFLHEEIMFNQGASKGEAFMYASRPGYAPCYITGFVMIMELRRKMMEIKRERFNLREFHDSLLSKGCIPFKLLTTLL